MKIIKLSVENIKRLKAVEIAPQGDVIRITGANSQGKSSVLDAIWYALGGTKSLPEQPLREGQRKGYVELDLGDLVVIRKFTSKGSALEVCSGDRVQQKSPQRILDALVGRLCFDPMAFLSMPAKKQAELLRQVVEIPEDLDALDAERVRLYEDRTEINRDAKRLESTMETMVIDISAPDAEISAQDLLQRIQAAEAVERQGESLEAKAEAANIWVSHCIDRVDALQEQLAQAQAELDHATIQSAELEAEVAAYEWPDIDLLRDEMATLDQRNAAARDKAKYKALDKDLRDTTAKADALSDAIRDIDQRKADALAAAQWPIDGLGFDGEMVTFNGLPLDQASTSQQIRVSMVLAMSSDPKLRVVRIADGSLLDSKSLAEVAAMAASYDCQVWIESVDESGAARVVIEDGMVAADNQTD